MKPQLVRAGLPLERIKLPLPVRESNTSIECALLQRRSIRELGGAPITLAELSQLLWAAQGITDPDGYRTAPSAGALYPLEVYVLAGHVTGLPAGMYKYAPHGHTLLKIGEDDRRLALSHAAHDQQYIANAIAVLVFCAMYERTIGQYGKRGAQYVHIEAGHAAQNVYLQAVSLQIGTVAVGAFDDAQVIMALALGDEEHPLYIMPIGRR